MLRIFRAVPAWFRARYVGPLFAFDAIMLALDAKREMNESVEHQQAATETALLRAGQPF